MNNFLESFFWIILTIAAYFSANKIYLKFKKPFLNPVLLSSVMLILILVTFKVPLETYNKGGSVITTVLGPLVVVLSIPLDKNRKTLLKNFIPIMAGTIAGILTSFVSVTILCRLFNIDDIILNSLMAKSITTPMAIEVTKMLGGNEAITIAAVIFTGVVGACIAPSVLKLVKIKNDTAKGIAIGNSSHAIGTSRTVEMGEEVASASSLAIALTGILTVFIVIIFF